MSPCIRKTLITWIGHHDLWGMAAEAGGRTADEVVGVAGPAPANFVGPGPIKTLVSQIEFRQVHLVTNFPRQLGDAFGKWLGCLTETHTVTLSDPTNYRAVFEAANEAFARAWQTMRGSERLCVHLSPGTPTMAAVSVLLAKTRFPAILYQTYHGEVREENIPFDIQLDYLPELLRDPDAFWEASVAKNPFELPGFESIVGESQSLRLAAGKAQRAAIRDVNVLITGESGTGKEMFARAIHAASARGAKFPQQFKAVNCAAIPYALLESEIFGVAKGAATDVKERLGAFQSADRGTLFLDEVGELSAENQAKLLRALQPQPGDPPCKRWIRRVGDDDDSSVDVRVIAATNCNLVDRIAENRFREDLYYRLATVTIEIPPLRDRRADIPHLANHILARVNAEFSATEPGYTDRQLSGGAVRSLRNHSWPGNVRELNSVLVQAAVMCSGTQLLARDIDAAITQMPGIRQSGPFSRRREEGFALKRRLQEIERSFIEDALEESEGNQTCAARLLDISQQALSKKLRTQPAG